MPIKITGLNQARKNMKTREEAFKGTKTYDDVGKIASKDIARQVQAGGDPAWKPRKYQYSHPILDKTGRMRDKAEKTATEWKHGQVWHINTILGPLYGRVHQYTGVRTKIGGSLKKIIRKYVVFKSPVRKKMIQVFRDAFLLK